MLVGGGTAPDNRWATQSNTATTGCIKERVSQMETRSDNRLSSLVMNATVQSYLRCLGRTVMKWQAIPTEPRLAFSSWGLLTSTPPGKTCLRVLPRQQRWEFIREKARCLLRLQRTGR